MDKRTGFLRARINSFGFALKGIRLLVRSQANARIHLLMTVVVTGLGFYFELSAGEWVALVLSIALVWMAEGMNTAIEALTDLVSPQHHPLAEKAKDLAAGAVLIAALGAAITGILVFFPYLKKIFLT